MNASIHHMRTGAGCSPCPPGGFGSAAEMAASYGRGLPGTGRGCKYNLLPLVIEGLTAAGGDVTVNVDSPIAICTESIIAIATSSSGLFTGEILLKDLTFGNRPQWIIGQDYDAGLFGLDSECSCCLPGDCINVGTPVSLTASYDATGVETLTVYVYIRGPSID